MSRPLAALALLLGVASPGCFTIARWSQDVDLTSNVPGTRIELADEAWTTPATAEVERSRKPRMLVATAEGRTPVTFEVVTTEARISDLTWYEVLFVIGDGLTIIPGIVDLCISDVFFDYPYAIDVRLLDGAPGDVWVQREEGDPKRPMAVDPVTPAVPHPRAEAAPPAAAPAPRSSGGVRSAGR
jgi:hypothetical protein